MTRRAATLTAAVIAATIAGAPAHAAPVRVVKLQNFEVRPASVQVKRGGIVEWRFLDGVSPHNVTSRGRRRFKSSPSQRSGSYRVRFRRSGTYRYVCTIHPSMRGRVVVR